MLDLRSGDFLPLWSIFILYDECHMAANIVELNFVENGRPSAVFYPPRPAHTITLGTKVVSD